MHVNKDQSSTTGWIGYCRSGLKKHSLRGIMGFLKIKLLNITDDRIAKTLLNKLKTQEIPSESLRFFSKKQLEKLATNIEQDNELDRAISGSYVGKAIREAKNAQIRLALQKVGVKAAVQSDASNMWNVLNTVLARFPKQDVPNEQLQALCKKLQSDEFKQKIREAVPVFNEFQEHMKYLHILTEGMKSDYRNVWEYTTNMLYNERRAGEGWMWQDYAMLQAVTDAIEQGNVKNTPAILPIPGQMALLWEQCNFIKTFCQDAGADVTTIQNEIYEWFKKYLSMYNATCIDTYTQPDSARDCTKIQGYTKIIQPQLEQVRQQVIEQCSILLNSARQVEPKEFFATFIEELENKIKTPESITYLKDLQDAHTQLKAIINNGAIKVQNYSRAYDDVVELLDPATDSELIRSASIASLAEDPKTVRQFLSNCNTWAEKIQKRAYKIQQYLEAHQSVKAYLATNTIDSSPIPSLATREYTQKMRALVSSDTAFDREVNIMQILCVVIASKASNKADLINAGLDLLRHPSRSPDAWIQQLNLTEIRVNRLIIDQLAS